MSSKYVDMTAITQVIGCVFNDATLMADTDRYFICEEDFPEEFHRIIFGSIYNIYQTGSLVNLDAIVDYLAVRPKYDGIFKKYNGIEFLTKASQMATKDTFNYYYSRLKKFTLLRAYDNFGLDISWLYDANNILDIQKKQRQEDWLDNTSLIEIAQAIDIKIEEIKNRCIDNELSEGYQAGEGMLDLIEDLKAHPEVGVPLYGRLINTVTRGARLRKLYLRSGATGTGKAIPNYTIIPTPNGYKRVGDIKVGDYLFGQDGKPTKVLATYPQPEQKEIWKVTFKSGRIAECCNEHLWSFYSIPHGRKLYTKSLKEIYKESQLNNFKRFNKYCYRVPIAEPVELPTKNYSIEPYVLGLLLGDGSFRYDKSNKSLMFSSENDILPREIAKRYDFNVKRHSANPFCWFFEHKNKNASHLNVWVKEILKDYPELWNCSSHTKFIPQDYLYGSIEQRLELLRGLMDTDGSITFSSGRVSYTTVSPQLKDDFMALLASLGMLFHLYEECKLDGRIAYHIDILIDNDKKEQLFHLERKKQLARDFLKTHPSSQRGDRKTDPIIKIESLNEKTAMTCFMVDNKNHLFIAGSTWWVTHNTRTMIADACNFACDMIYDDQFGWRKNGVTMPTLYIATEQDKSEVQTMMLAFLANVNEEHILNGMYVDDEYERVCKAAEIFSKSPIWIEELPDFSLQDIENKIKTHIREHDVKYVVHDYLHTSMKILEEITRKSGGVRLREDNILFMLSTRLKDLCNKYGIFILSGTQLNGDYKDATAPDQNLLRGAKSIADKIDVGMILLSVTDEDLVKLEPILANNHNFEIPNIKLSIYKNRRGSYKGVFLWCKADLGTCRVQPQFCTTYGHEIVGIEDIKVIVDEPGAF